MTAGLACGFATATALIGVGVSPAAADVTRCVGAVATPGAFACYTSPRFDHAGLDRTKVATVPEVCYGLGCTSTQLIDYTPTDTFAGRFTAVSYLGHSYTVYRPTAAQPYVITSDNPRISPLEAAEVLALSSALDALNT